MTKDKIISGLKMTMELFLFDPSTGETCEPDDLNELNRTTYDACKGAVELLGNPEPHWIPVAERLPDEDQPVLVTDGAVMWVCSLIRTDDGYKWESNMGYWHDFDEWEAWKSLPEPYKGVTE